jgi:hypothetical protein
MYDEYNVYSIIIAICLTFLSYIAYPFIRVIIMKKEYTPAEVKKMALLNSIIVGGIFLILTAALYDDITWSSGPAFIYYFINKSIWIKKKKSTNKSKKVEYKSSNALTNYNELIKLKELLDNGILTQEEFDEEKSKLLS